MKKLIYYVFGMFLLTSCASDEQNELNEKVTSRQKNNVEEVDNSKFKSKNSGDEVAVPPFSIFTCTVTDNQGVNWFAIGCAYGSIDQCPGPQPCTPVWPLPSGDDGANDDLPDFVHDVALSFGLDTESFIEQADDLITPDNLDENQDALDLLIFHLFPDYDESEE